MVDLRRETYSISVDDMAECWEKADRELEEDLRNDESWERYKQAVEKTRLYDLRRLIITS